MSDFKEILKSVLNAQINDDRETANAGIHDYIVAKLQSLSGLSADDSEQFDNKNA